MPYKIKVEYRTGDSFGYEDTSIVLDYIWTNIDIAKENLERIKKHYQWSVSEFNNREWFLKNVPDFIENKDWEKKNWGHSKYVYTVPLKLDDGQEKDFSAVWTGYFEHLYGASIIDVEEDGWSFTL